MASGSAGRANSGSKGFDFASDDILCTYDDFANQDSSNGSHSDVIGSDSAKDFQKTRMARSSAYPVSSYNQPEDSLNPDMVTIVERTMKKQNDNVMRYLEGISSRLSQLELHCYNLDKSVGEMRSDLVRGHEEADTKLKALEKHIQEVHRSVQILRDKQELADTQKELAKLQLVHKDSSSSIHSQPEEKVSPPEPDSKKPENSPETYNNQLAIVPKQSQAPPQNLPPQQPYYMPPAQLPNPPAQLLNPPAQTHHHQAQYMTQDPQYQPQAPPPVSQAPQGQQFPPYQQQWPQQPAIQPPMRPSSPSVYPTYPPTGQPANSPPSDAAPYGYGPTRMPTQPLPKANYGAQPGDVYPPTGPPHSALPPSSGYMVYDSEGGRTTHHVPPQQAHFPPGTYPPPNRNPNHSQYVRNHPYNELVEKLVSMGFRGDHVVSVIQRMEESGQPVDFNAVLDRLSGSSGGSQRGGWSG